MMVITDSFDINILLTSLFHFSSVIPHNLAGIGYIYFFPQNKIESLKYSI